MLPAEAGHIKPHTDHPKNIVTLVVPVHPPDEWQASYGGVTVSIVTWNHAGCIEACLQSLLRQTHAIKQIVVADNGSTDGTPAVLEKFAGRIKIRNNGRNLGFCGGHNATLRDVRSEFVLLANPDAVFEPDYVAEALKAFEKNPRVGTVCGILYRDGLILDGAGLSIRRSRQFTLVGSGRTAEVLPRQDFEVFGADGAAPMYRKAMIDELSIDGQFFDEMFFAHKEDHDVSWRARLRGWETLCAVACKAVHPRNFRPNNLRRRKEMHPLTRLNAVKNYFLVLMKNDDALSLLRDLPWWLPRQLAIFGYILLFERESLAAYDFLWRHRREIREARRRVRELRTSSRRDISAWFNRSPV